MAWVEAASSRRPLNSGRWAGAQFLVLSEETTNDNDKSLVFNTDVVGVLPQAKCAELLWMALEYNADGTMTGNRNVRCNLIAADSDIIAGFGAVDLIAQSQSFTYMYGRDLETVDPSAATPAHERIPRNFMFYKGQTLNILDRNDIDANDNMVLHVALAVYS